MCEIMPLCRCLEITPPLHPDLKQRSWSLEVALQRTGTIVIAARNIHHRILGIQQAPGLFGYVLQGRERAVGAMS